MRSHVDYDNGYQFDLQLQVEIDDHFYDSYKLTRNYTPFSDFKILESEPTEYTIAISVPNVVEENSDAPLLVKLLVPVENESDVKSVKEFTYKVR